MGIFSGLNLWGKPKLPKEIERLHDGSMFYVFGGSDSDRELDFKVLYKVYQLVPQLRAVIDQKCHMFASGWLRIKKLGTDEILETHPLQNILNKPNAFQSTREWMFMVQAYKCITGDSFLYKKYAAGQRAARNLNGLTPLDYESIDVKTRQNIFAYEVDTPGQLIDSLKFKFKDGHTRTFKGTDLEDLIHFKDSGVKFTDATSKIVTLRDAITNVYEAMKGRQTMIRRKGGIGALTGAQKNGEMAVSMSPNEKKSIYDRLRNFGVSGGKEPIIVTDVPLRWQPFVFPTRELMLFEEVEDGFHQFCDAYGIRREIFEGQSNYSNKEHAERGTYQDTIIPEWEDFCNKLNNGLNTAKEGIEIFVDYSHIPILQQNEKENVETQKVKSDRLLNELNAGLITGEEYRDQMGYQGGVPEPKEEEPTENES